MESLEFISYLDENTIPLHLHGITCLYRVRTDTKDFDDTNPAEFSYIQDVNKIKRQRFNREGEQVLYTSTFPNIAVMETLKEDYNDAFYIGKWKNIKQDNKLWSFVAVDDNCSTNTESSSRKVREVIKEQFTKEQLQLNDVLRIILEKDYTGVEENKKYEESSLLASKIFNVVDCILSYSKCSSKKLNCDEYLNVTLNKKTVDESLKLDAVYHCKSISDHTSLCYNVDKIGLLNNGKIEWHKWCVDFNSIRSCDIPPRLNDDKQFFRKYMEQYQLNINIGLNELHTVLIYDNHEKIEISYKIYLQPIDNS